MGRIWGVDQSNQSAGTLPTCLGSRVTVVDFLGPFLQRELDSESLVDRKSNIEEVQAVDPQIINGMALGRNRIAWDVAGFRNNGGDPIECGRHR